MSVIYPKFKEEILKGTHNLSTAVVRAVLIDTGTYTYDAAHNAYDDLTGVVATESSALGTKTFTDGTFDSDAVTVTAATGVNAEAIVLFIDSGTPATDYLIAYIDSGTGLPVLPNGGDITITPNASGWFSL